MKWVDRDCAKRWQDTGARLLHPAPGCPGGIHGTPAARISYSIVVTPPCEVLYLLSERMPVLQEQARSIAAERMPGGSVQPPMT